jgi:membrane protease YdiL (CAAX protease family)
MSLAAAFLVLLFGVSWLYTYVARSLLASGDLATFLAGMLPGVWAPTFIAILLLLWAGGTAAVRRELKLRLSYHSGSGRWLALAGGVPIILTAVALASARAAGDGAPFISSDAVLLTLGVQVITGASGEELGWRGYLLPRLGARVGALLAALATGTLWAVWHLPAFFTPGMPHQSIPIPMWSFLFVIACFGLFLALVFNESGASVLPAMLAHLSMNVTLALGGVTLSSVVFWRTMAALYGALALVVVVRLRTQGAGHYKTYDWLH